MNKTTYIHINMREKNAKIPMRSTQGSAGYDIFMNGEHVIHAKSVLEIELPFSISAEANSGLNIRLYVRSSYGFKKKVRLMNEEYQLVPHLPLAASGEIHTIRLYNDHEEDLIIPDGEHFAQFIIRDKEAAIQSTIIEPVKEEEAKKHRIPSGHMTRVSPNVYEYVMKEELILQPGEQKMIASGFKAKIDEGTWLGAYVPEALQSQLIFANGTPVVDKDYYNNPGNDGLMFFAFVNPTKETVIIPAGTPLATLRSEKYYALENEIQSDAIRTGGIGSTTK